MGIALILLAANELIFSIDSRAYAHTLNLVFVLFAPMYFLSLIPLYPGAENNARNQEDMKITAAAHCPKFLQILISYILIPLIVMFTFILVIYIIKNISGPFWTDNLLEPMIVSYAITVILMYILASEIDNRFTVFFRKVFPKLLVPIVHFQIISSILSSTGTGITHTRYYAVLFGIFAAASSMLWNFLRVRKNGMITALLTIFASVSLVPPVDAFTISRTSQTNLLKNVLIKNKMLENNKIKPNASISENDKQIITNTMYYLSMMEYTKNIPWLPDRFNPDTDFYQTFGFKEYQKSSDANQSIYLSLEQPAPIPITGYDILVQTDINVTGGKRVEKICDIEKDSKKYTLLKEINHDQVILRLSGENGQELIRFNTQYIYDRFINDPSIKEQISPKAALPKCPLLCKMLRLKR